tara:strand:- start:129 stop:377 length:249 start_codon:yes stop_codon:yes gene_type:complete
MKRVKKYSKGDLVYIPQAVNLFSYRDSEKHFSMNMRLKIPRNCLVINTTEEEDHVGVLYDGETWFVKEADVYPTPENAKGIE